MFINYVVHMFFFLKFNKYNIYTNVMSLWFFGEFFSKIRFCKIIVFKIFIWENTIFQFIYWKYDSATWCKCNSIVVKINTITKNNFKLIFEDEFFFFANPKFWLQTGFLPIFLKYSKIIKKKLNISSIFYNLSILDIM